MEVEVEQPQLFRLTLDDPRFPLLWPQLCARVRAMWNMHAPYMPATEILQAWFNMITSAPNLLPIWLVVDEDNKIVLHFIAETTVYHGKYFVHIHQLQSNRHDTVRRVKSEGIRLLLEWIYDINKRLNETDIESRIEVIRLLTPRSPKVWKRWLPLDCILLEHTMTFSIPEKKPQVDET